MKRSVALVVMTAATVGTAGYSLMPRDDCGNRGAVVEPSVAGSRCGSGGSGSSSGGSGGHGSRSVFGSSGSSDGASGGASGNAAGTQRGGFGAFARSVGAHFGSFGG